MSREIKFRAWDGKSMIEPYSVRNGKAFIIKRCDQNEPVIKGSDGSNYYKNWDVDVSTDYPLMQFTGLRDGNGVDIYEGDLIEAVSRSNPYDSKALFKVHYDKEYGSFVGHVAKKIFPVLTPANWPLGELRFSAKVIGNIYEHPHLLDEAK